MLCHNAAALSTANWCLHSRSSLAQSRGTAQRISISLDTNGVIGWWVRCFLQSD